MRRPVQFGKYILLDRISVGGMAEVFKAKTFGVEGFEKVIAIKRILPSMGEDEDFISMFIDEAKIAGQLSHANIGQIHELGEVEGSHFIAMEYIQGRDLLQLQKRYRKLKKQIPVNTACFILIKVCEGLNYAHKKRDVLGENLQIDHRDCTPQNVVVSYEGEVKLIDFGIARAASRSSRTQAGVLKGKFAYMSPEQVRGLPLDRRSDIFSLGIILFECLTGDRLFNAESDFATLERVRNAEFDRSALKNAGVPPEVEEIVFKALSRSTEDRYQWCSEMRSDLSAYLKTVDSVYTSRSLGEEVREVFAKERQRDRELMDSYSKIRRGDALDDEPDMQIFVEGTGEARPHVLPRRSEPLPPSLASGSGPRPRTSDDDESDFDDGSTEVFGEDGMAELLKGMGVEAKAESEGSAPKRALAHYTGASNIEVRNQEESSAPARPPNDAHRAETVAQPQDPRPPAPAPAPAPPVPLAGPSAAAPRISAQYVAPVATPPQGFPPRIDQFAHARSSSMPLPAEPSSALLEPKSSNNKGIWIGLAVAIVAGLAFVAVKMFVLSGDTEAANTPLASLIVMVSDNEGGDVLIEGKKVGTIVAGDSLRIDDLKPGKFEIKVERKGLAVCTDKIAVSAERAKFYNCDSEEAAEGVGVETPPAGEADAGEADAGEEGAEGGEEGGDKKKPEAKKEEPVEVEPAP